jgi:HEAT repeat protein
MPALSTDWKLARMKCAGSMETKQAAKIFMEYRLDDNEQVRIASLVGITKIAPAKFSQEVLIILNSRNPRHRQAAIGLLAILPVDGLLAGLDGLSPENQVLVVETLSGRKASEAEAAVLALTASENEAVRNAAFRALEMVGGTDSIQPLLAAALNHPAAYDALCGLNAAGTDAALIQALERHWKPAMKPFRSR